MGVPEAIRIGPFVGGLNTASDPTSVQDVDLVLCENFELDLDGALTNRQPFVDTGVDFPLPEGGAIRMLGFFTSTTGTHYLIASDSVSKTYYFSGSSWELITDALAATAMCQYRDKAWLTAGIGSSQTGGSWSPGTAFAAVSGMPQGETIVTNKERLWIGPGPAATSDGGQLSYSAVGEPNKWPNTSPAGGGYFNVNNGDGENIYKVMVYFSDLVIFKSHSIYRFTFSTDPGQGSLTRLSDTIGLAGVNCVVAYESDIYLMYTDKIYLLSNYNFTRANIKVPLKAVTPTMSLAEPFSLSVWNDHLIAAYHDTTFVLNLRTRAWCTWKSDLVGPIGRVMEPPSQQGNARIAYLHSNSYDAKKFYTVSSETGIGSEPMTCKVRTKNYDYQSSHTFKKLAQWGADLVAKNKVTGVVTPVVYNVPVTWAQVAEHSWDELGTWGNLLGSTLEIVDPVDIGGSTFDRKYVRFTKTLRFRQVYFELRFDTNGSSSEAPAKLFSLTTFVGSKQITPKKVN